MESLDRRSGRLSDALQRADLDARDRAFALEIASGVVRRRRLIDHLLAPLATRGLPRESRLCNALRIGAYELLYLRVPAHAAVHEAVALAGRHGAGFVNAVLRRLARSILERPARPDRETVELPLADGRCLALERALPDPVSAHADHVAVVHGLPTFLVEGWCAEYGPDRARTIAEASITSPAVLLRAVAPRVGDAHQLAARLSEEEVTTVPGDHPSVLRWTGGRSPFGTGAFAEGLFVAQDPTAVRAAEALGASPGETVLDLCAAPGMKAALLAEAVGQDGLVYAYDPNPARRRLLHENADRLRLTQLRVIDDLNLADRAIDRVLADVPCTNTGVLARRVEVRLWLEAADISERARAQREILERALGLLRQDAQGGVRVVYSTCSIEPAENQEIVDSVAAAVGADVLASTLTLPDPPNHDGGYFAAIGAPTTRA